MAYSAMKNVSTSRYLAGKKAKSEGKNFEEWFKTLASYAGDSYHVERIPDGCKVVGVDRFGRPRLVREKTPFDWIIVNENKTIFLDTKSFDAKWLTPSMLTDHQVESLGPIHRFGLRTGFQKAGYLVLFRQLNEISFVPGDLLELLLAKKIDRIHHDDVSHYKVNEFRLSNLFE